MTPRFIQRAAGVALALALAAGPTLAQIPLKNIQLYANRNDYPPAPGSWGYSACWGYVHPDGREYAILGTHDGTAIYNVTDPANVHFVKLIPGLASNWREMKAYRNWIYVVTEAYMMSPSGIQPGLQIIRMTDPENPVLAATYGINFNRSHTVAVDTSRAILICNGTNYYDTAAQTTTVTGMRILSLANPESPVEIAAWPLGPSQTTAPYYVHDCVPFGNRLYASSIYAGTQRIFAFTDPAHPTEIKSWTYPAAYYTHSCWPDAARDRLYVCDEQNGQTLRVFDISNETAPVLVNQWTSNPQAIAHNPRVSGTDLWVANYTEGVRALDVFDPTHPVEWGYADSYGGASGGYNGVWEVYPFFPSGTVIASDMNTGLYVYRPDKNFGVAYASVRDGRTPVAGAKVYVAETGDSVATGADGVAAIAPSPGTYTLLVRKFGYQDATTSVTLNRGSHVALNFPLIARPSGRFSGSVVDAGTGIPLQDAEVDVRYTPVQSFTDASGTFDLGSLPLDTYRIEVRRPGYIPVAFERRIDQVAQTQQFKLVRAAAYDPLTTDRGWTVGSSDDNAVTGVWVRVEPFGTTIGAPVTGVDVDACGCGSGCSCTTFGQTAAKLATGACCGGACSAGASAMPMSKPSTASCMAVGSERARMRAAPNDAVPEPVPSRSHEVSRAKAPHVASGGASGGSGPVSAIIQVQPEYDRSPPPDSLCWVTGQGTIHTSIDEADVDGPAGGPGKTTLTSPAYDMTGMTTPAIGYWAWFYSQFGSQDDWLATLISNDNGATWVPVDTLRGIHNQWEEHAIDLSSHVTPTSQVKVRFVAADFGQSSVVEAAIDDIAAYDASIPAAGAGRAAPPQRLAFRPPMPNPARGGVALTLDVPRSGALEIELVDLAGRRVAALYDGRASAGPLLLAWNGKDASGRTAPAGLYFARARLEGQATQTRIVQTR